MAWQRPVCNLTLTAIEVAQIVYNFLIFSGLSAAVSDGGLVCGKNSKDGHELCFADSNNCKIVRLSQNNSVNLQRKSEIRAENEHNN